MKRINRTYLILFFLSSFLFVTNNLKAQMFWNKACSFNSSDSSHVSVPDNSSLDITGSFTIECWINPVNSASPFTQTIFQKRTTGNPNTGYSLILISGKISVTTNTGNTLTGKTIIQNNQWTHIAARYNSATNTFSTYVNGVIDSSTVIPGAKPVANNDSIIIGIGRGIGEAFTGMMDDVRLWNRALTASEISTYFKTSLGVNTGIYKGLVLSLPFQKEESTSPVFSTNDFSGTGNNGYSRNLASFDMSNKASKTITYNESAEFDGNNDYLAAAHSTVISPVQSVTLEAWIYPRSNANSIIIHKGSDNGSVTNFRLAIENKKLTAGIKQNFSFTTNDTIATYKWSHVAFTYSGTDGKYVFYLNGNIISEGINNVGLMSVTTDSLYIGGSLSLPDFDGYIDEVRITEDEKTQNDINKNLFASIDKSIESVNDDAVYNLDGLGLSNTGQGPKLNFRNNARFSHPATIPGQPVSPCLRSDPDSFQNSFYIRKTDLRIPFANETGTIEDAMEVYENTPISDISVFVALNHQDLSHLRILLTAPNDEYALLFYQTTTKGTDNNLVTVFDDNGDTTGFNVYTSLSPSITPVDNINAAFNGNTKGVWRLTIFDYTGADTGRLYGWGIRFNNQTSVSNILETSILIEGFYNPATNNTVRDTVTYNLRNFDSPYSIVESKKLYIPQNNISYIKFNNAVGAASYYIEATHRNSIGIWSSSEIKFSPLTHQTSFKFVNALTSAYGSNMAKVDSSPLRYAMYGGDVNQDGNVGALDVSAIDNDVFNFVSGYVVSDVTGNNVTDASDLAIADNNAFNFVSRITPP